MRYLPPNWPGWWAVLAETAGTGQQFDTALVAALATESGSSATVSGPPGAPSPAVGGAPGIPARQDGEAGLRERLGALDVKQLKDVIAEFGMNYDGRAMKWRDPQRMVDRIMERTSFGTSQGSAFRGDR